MQFVVRNVPKVELVFTSATIARNFARKVPPCIRALNAVEKYLKKLVMQFRITYIFVFLINRFIIR